MRILILSPSVYPEPGGLQRYTYNLAVSLARRKHKVLLITLDKADSFVCPNSNLTYSAVRRWSSVGNGFLEKLWQKVYLGWTLWKTVENLNPDEIICTWWDPLGYLATLISRLKSVPFIIVGHGQEVIRLPQRVGTKGLKMWLRNLAFRYATLVVAVSNFTKKRIMDMGVDEDRIKVVPNGLSSDYIEEASGFSKEASRALLKLDGHVILQVGRLVPRKGHELVLKALRTVKQELDEPVCYVVVGSGPYRKELETGASQLGMRENTVFTGFISDEELHRYYSASDLVVMPSFNPTDPGDVEGFGIAYLEAYAHAKPVIGASAGGVSDVIINEKTGLLIPPGDIKALAAGILRLLRNTSEATTMGLYGQKLVNIRWNWNILCDEFLL
jgi:phosphatidylinositol alpha-1,6-mannosyltransferase